jgi:hypothetical protein
LSGFFKSLAELGFFVDAFDVLGFLVDAVDVLGFLLLAEALEVEGRLACFEPEDMDEVGLDVAGLAAGLEPPPEGLFCA